MFLLNRNSKDSLYLWNFLNINVLNVAVFVLLTVWGIH